MFERLPAQTFHHQKQLAIEFANFVDRANARMVQRRSGLGFAREALQQVGIVCARGRDEFDGDVTAERGVDRPVSWPARLPI